MKAQVAVEFILVFIFMLLLMVGAVMIANQKTLETHGERINFEAEGAVYKAASAVNTAHLEGDGFSMSFILPGTIGGHNYSINRDSNYMWIDLLEKHYFEGLLTDNVTGTPVPGSNRVENIGGMVYVNA